MKNKMKTIRNDEHNCLWGILDTSPSNVVLFIIGFDNTSIENLSYLENNLSGSQIIEQRRTLSNFLQCNSLLSICVFVVCNCMKGVFYL